jgi:choline-sulfatase
VPLRRPVRQRVLLKSGERSVARFVADGLYTHNHGAYNNTVPWPFEHKTIAHHFDRAGYITALIGKIHFVDAQTHSFEYRVDCND